MTQFGYRKIDTTANENSRNWIAAQLESYGYQVERQSFTTDECSNCQNIVVTINGTLENEWIDGHRLHWKFMSTAKGPQPQIR
jgi:acetylornithine deacetylase/succinyl-diaminopimelate desuccinylase-like protein